MNESNGFELRVLTGEQAGAKALIQPENEIIISGGFDGDIIIRDASICSTCISLKINNSSAKLKVLSGHIEVRKNQYIEGDQLNLPAYTVFKLGETVLAYGVPGDGQWEYLLNTDYHASENKKYNDDQFKGKISSTSKNSAFSLATLSKTYKATILVSIIFLASVSLITVSAYSGTNPNNEIIATIPSEGPDNIARILTEAGFDEITVEQADNLNFVVHGEVVTKQQKELLEQILRDIDRPYKLQVVVGEQLASSVEEVFRVNGVNAEVTYRGPGTVTANTVEGNVAKLDRVANTAKRDIVGLKEIILQNVKPEKPAETSVLPNDPGKRIASVVPGNPAYLVTVDGARYFVGAMMPTGHKISAIFDQRVSLSKDGKVTTLEF